MKPAAFEYFRPKTIGEACSALNEAKGEAKLIAGGQSLGPMLNLRLVQPGLLVDIAGLQDLSQFDQDSDSLRIGACITASNIEDQRIDTSSNPLLLKVASGIAYRAVRNRGTIGGSLCHSDPAADWVNVLPALGASYAVTGPRGTHHIPAADFMTAAFETKLKQGEVLQTIIIPKLSKRARFGYAKIARKTGKFAIAIGVTVFDPGRDLFTTVIGATHGKPILVKDARELFGSRPGEGPLKFDATRANDLLSAHGVPEGPARQIHRAALERAAAEGFSS